MSQRFDEASVARILLSSCPFSIHAIYKSPLPRDIRKGVSYSGKKLSLAITTGLTRVSTGTNNQTGTPATNTGSFPGYSL